MFLTILLFSLLNLFLFYTDPGSGQLILQLIAATFLGGLFYIRKIKEFLFRKKNSSSQMKDTDDLKPSE